MRNGNGKKVSVQLSYRQRSLVQSPKAADRLAHHLKEVVKLVEDLSVKNLKDPKCFTLLTISMTSMNNLTQSSDVQGDIETQHALALAIKHDANGERRFGIFES